MTKSQTDAKPNVKRLESVYIKWANAFLIAGWRARGSTLVNGNTFELMTWEHDRAPVYPTLPNESRPQYVTTETVPTPRDKAELGRVFVGGFVFGLFVGVAIPAIIFSIFA